MDVVRRRGAIAPIMLEAWEGLRRLGDAVPKTPATFEKVDEAFTRYLELEERIALEPGFLRG